MSAFVLCFLSATRVAHRSVTPTIAVADTLYLHKQVNMQLIYFAPVFAVFSSVLCHTQQHRKPHRSYNPRPELSQLPQQFHH